MYVSASYASSVQLDTHPHMCLKNDLEGGELSIIAFGHLFRSTRVLNNTEVKERNSTTYADMHVSASYASSVQLGTYPHMWLHHILYT